jgi:ubiquitin C-terminal hydrolase
MLEGDNAYLCAKCDRKVDTLKRTCVKVLPRNLIMTLKRFEFDFDRMVRVKLNDYCEFPLELDMLPYTQEGLARKERATRRKQEAAERGEEVQEDVDAEPLKHDKDYYQFKLKGVVVHTGTADSGHYYSFIRDHESQDGERWYEFNDNIVRDFDIADLPNETFGGFDVFNGQGMMQMKSQKWRNAYIVIYERKN